VSGDHFCTKRTVTLTLGNLSVTIVDENPSDPTIWGIGDQIQQALAGLGFHHQNIDDLFRKDKEDA
jgi:hypothetical protein